MDAPPVVSVVRVPLPRAVCRCLPSLRPVFRIYTFACVRASVFLSCVRAPSVVCVCVWRARSRCCFIAVCVCVLHRFFCSGKNIFFSIKFYNYRTRVRLLKPTAVRAARKTDDPVYYYRCNNYNSIRKFKNAVFVFASQYRPPVADHRRRENKKKKRYEKGTFCFPLPAHSRRFLSVSATSQQRVRMTLDFRRRHLLNLCVKKRYRLGRRKRYVGRRRPRNRFSVARTFFVKRTGGGGERTL